MLLIAMTLALAQDAPRKPHLVYLLADDLGWKDVGYHGSEIRTPHLDTLAAEGARLEAFYVQPVCSPTRAALLTGRYPMRHGLQVGVVRPHAQYGLPLEERTLPQALQEAGYVTAMFGKWHLGSFDSAYWPTSRGFQRWTGHLFGAIDYFTHMRDGKDDWYVEGKPAKAEGYATHLIAKAAVELLRAHDPAKPLFLYVPFNATHTPFQAPAEDVDAYKAIAEKNRRIKAAMTTSLDAAVGEILEELGRRGMRENTLILFSSDNGGPVGGGASDNGPYRAGKGTLYEGGVRVAALANWPGKIRAGSVVNEVIHAVDVYPTLIGLARGSLAQPRPLDGRDAWGTIAEGKPSPREELLLNVEPKRGAVRRGPWKLVVQGALPAAGLEGVKAELFNVAEDPAESANLAAAQPEKVRELMERLNAYAREAVPPKSQD